MSNNASSRAGSTETPATAASQLKRNSDDVGWEYGVLCNANDPDKWKCKKCGSIFSGGVYRIKQHIAKIKGNVRGCLSASNEDKKRCQEALESTKRKKQGKLDVYVKMRSEIDIGSGKGKESEEMEEEEDDEVHIGGSKKGPRTIGSIDRFVSKINSDDGTSYRQQNLNEAISKERLRSVHQYVAKWAYENSIAFHAVDNASFMRMAETIGQYSRGYTPPSQYLLGETLLKGEVEATKRELKVQEEEWERSGCSIMTDAWSDRKRRNIMNLCVNSRSGTTFLESKETTLDAHTGEYIFVFVDECVESIGEEKVVQVVTDNASNNMAAIKLLFQKRPHIFWTPCATHTMNLMLEAIGKLTPFMNTITKAKYFIVFIYSHHKTLALMRKMTKREIVRPGVTRFASAFLTLQSLLEVRSELKHMVVSDEWDSTKWSKSKKGKIAYAIIMQSQFWSSVNMCVKVFTPLVKVLRLVDGDVKPAMGFVYGELKKAKEEIKEALNHKEEKYKPILSIVDAKSKGRIDTPLHLTAYLLNPYYYYNGGEESIASSVEGKQINDGVLECMEQLFPNVDELDEVVNVEMVKYKLREGVFGRPLTQRAWTKPKYDPVGWWSSYGHDTPTLQKVAMRILSLTTSSSGCERNWSVFEAIHTKKRNRLDAGRMSKLVYVQFNARLMEKRKKRSDKVDVLLANEASRAQSWLVDGVVDFEDEEVTPGSGLTWGMVGEASGENEELQPRRSARRVEEVRELDEQEFVSDGTEDEEEDDVKRLNLSRLIRRETVLSLWMRRRRPVAMEHLLRLLLISLYGLWTWSHETMLLSSTDACLVVYLL